MIRPAPRLVLVLGLVALSLGITRSAEAAAATYYVDCAAGQDTNAGTSQAAAWRSLSRANSAALVPGDRLLLKRGCTWNSQRLEAGWTGTRSAPIVISAYGTGARPLIRNGLNQNVRITGAFQVIDQIAVDFVTTRFSSCGSPLGMHYGFNLQPGAHDNTVQASKASGETAGVHIARGASSNRILGNQLVGNNMLTEFNADPEVDQGAWGLLLNGDQNEIANNTFAGNTATCSNQGWAIRSKSINVYEASSNNVHHNVSYDRVFVELGSSRSIQSRGNRFSYNVFTSTMEGSRFVTTRGALDRRWGPVPDTRLAHNTTYQTGAGSQGIVCGLGCDATILTTESNIVWAEAKAIYTDGNHGDRNDIYWSSTGGTPTAGPWLDAPQLDPSSRVIDPRFVDAAAGNFRLQAGSPAIDRGRPTGTWTIDVYGTPLPQGVSVDIGSAEQPA